MEEEPRGEVEEGERPPEGAAYRRRATRLVTMQVPVHVRFPDGTCLSGETTGLNENGLGARLDLAGDTEARGIPKAGQPVNIELELPRKDRFLVRAKVLRVENSWVPGYRYFLTFAFQTLSEKDMAFLKRFIQWREERYFTETGPQRLWYIFTTRKEEFGPLTTEEVRKSLADGKLRPEDWIWSGERGGWVRLRQVALLTDSRIEIRPDVRLTETHSWKRPFLGFLTLLLLVLLTAAIFFLARRVTDEGRRIAGTSPENSRPAAAPPDATGHPSRKEPAAVNLETPPQTKTSPPQTVDTEPARFERLPRPQVVISKAPATPRDHGPPPPRVFLVADFDKNGATEREWVCPFGAWISDPTDPTIRCFEAYDPDDREGKPNGYCLKLRYDLDGPNPAYGGLWLQFRDKGDTTLDLHRYRYLEFWARTGSGTLKGTSRFKVELKNARERGTVRITGLAPRWRKVTVPLAAFEGISDWRDMTEFVVVLERDEIDVRDGLIYLDDIGFRR
ncbi:MAG: hypothetical protein D6679_09385 [Candidatus Hydrogenedentota bacterium]|nr:MAG: hypothetical protein D6679_09385 [Candidatus Hydrogenedentota bacterium]